MQRPGAFGAELASHFGFRSAPAFKTQRLPEAEVAVTRIRCDNENNGMTAPFAIDDAFLVTIQLRDCPSHDLWIEGQARPTAHLAAGTVCVYDLRCNPVVNSISPFDNIHFYMPRRTLATIAEGDGIAPIDEIDTEPGIGFADGVLHGLAQSLLPAFDRPEQTNRLFVDHVSLAMAAHFARRFGHGEAALARPRFSKREVAVAKEMLDSHRNGSLSLTDLADEMGIPVGQFSDGFADATGVPAHRWQLGRRIDCALAMMREKRFPLEDIAQQSGFANVEHLDRIFLRSLGVTGRAAYGRFAGQTG